MLMLKRTTLAGCIAGDKVEVFCWVRVYYLSEESGGDCLEIESQYLYLHVGI